MVLTRKPPTERELLGWLRQIGDGLPPVKLSVVDAGPVQATDGKPFAVDALVDIEWQEKKYRFAAETSVLSTPKSLGGAILRARRAAEELSLHPLVVTTFLSEENLRWLEREQVSGLDLCGNGVVVVPGQFLLWRSGAANRYPRGTTIRNVYRGSSSLVARTFLLEPRYDSVGDVMAEILRRGGRTTLATVSKVCSALEEDLIVERRKIERTTKLRLLQPEKLLDALAAAFPAPTVTQRLVGKCSLSGSSLYDFLANWRKETGEQIARTGADSTERYATMAREPVASFYCTQGASLLRALGAQFTETAKFPNFAISETADPTVYFDVRDDFAASPIQCFLELQSGDKRERETAEQVRRLILRGLNGPGDAT